MDIETFFIEGLILITPKKHVDDRGFFIENFHTEKIKSLIPQDFVQDNLSNSMLGVLRGLHFQEPPFSQAKLVQVLKGRVLDVAVDLRKASKTFGCHVSLELNEQNMQQFYIPSGFAHGFVSLEENTIFQYKCTEFYAPSHEKTLLWNDPTLGIDWGIKSPIVSSKDLNGLSLSHYISPF